MAPLIAGLLYYVGLSLLAFCLAFFQWSERRTAERAQRAIQLVFLVFLCVGFALLPWLLAVANYIIFLIILFFVTGPAGRLSRRLAPDIDRSHTRPDPAIRAELERLTRPKNVPSAMAAFRLKEPDFAGLVDARAKIEAEPEAGLSELKVLAARGSPQACLYLAYAFEVGHGTSVDIAAAEDWYAKATESGWPEAMLWRGNFYWRQRRFPEVRQAFEPAATLGYIPAMIRLAQFYLGGTGGPTEHEQGVALLETATAQGSILARVMLGRVLIRSGYKPANLLRGLWLITRSYPHAARLIRRHDMGAGTDRSSSSETVAQFQAPAWPRR